MKIGIREAKNNLSKYADMVHDGQRVVVNKNGKPWFEMVPCAPHARSVAPLDGATPTIDEDAATAPLDEMDLPGWR